MKQDKLVIGYVETRNLPLLQDRDAACLDVVNLAFARVEGQVVTWDLLGHEQVLREAKRKNPGLKMVLSIGGWGCGGFSEAAATCPGRRDFAASAVDLVEKYGLDGLDVDWEYPCIGISGIAASQADKENFTLLLKQLRLELDAARGRHAILSIAAGGESYYTRCTQMDQVHQYLDYVMLMTYDLRGGFSVQTGHHANLYTTAADLSSASADRAVRLFVNAGVPRGKLVIGAAFYSRVWKGVPNQGRGYMQMAQTTGGYGPDYGSLVKDYIGKNGYVRHWDEEGKAPFLFNGREFISYEDEASIKCKLDYVKKRGLAGIMFWEYSQDATHQLVPMMAKELKGGIYGHEVV